MKRIKMTKRIGYTTILAVFAIAATFGVVYAYTTGADTIDMLAGDDTFEMNTGADQIRMSGGSDLIDAGYGEDVISLGASRFNQGADEDGTIDKITFYNGDAQLYFHEYDENSTGDPETPVYVEYTETSRDLVVHVDHDFVVQLDGD